MYQIYKHKACNYRAKITMLHRIKRKLLFKNKQLEPVKFSLFIHPIQVFVKHLLAKSLQVVLEMQRWLQQTSMEVEDDVSIKD